MQTSETADPNSKSGKNHSEGESGMSQGLLAKTLTRNQQLAISIAIVLIVIVVIAAIAVPRYMTSHSGTLVVSITNASGLSSCDYMLYLDGYLERDSTLSPGETHTITKVFFWTGADSTIQIHITVPGSTAQPPDARVVLEPDEVFTHNTVIAPY